MAEKQSSRANTAVDAGILATPALDATHGHYANVIEDDAGSLPLPSE